VDRLDRRRLLVAVNLLRGAALAGLAVTVWGGAVGVPVVYAALFLLGVGGTWPITPRSRCCPPSCPPIGSRGLTPA
jgi:hypothetical protein